MTPGSRFIPASPNYTVVKRRDPLEDGLPKMRWKDRWKTDFILAKPPYEVKTTSQALRVLFSPFWEVSDLVNPKFIRRSDYLFARSVENLVLAVRGLSAKSFKNAHQALRRIPLFEKILQVIRDWDIDTLERELTLLQRDPRDRTFAALAPMTAAILKPCFLLSRLNLHVHLLPAVTKMYELGRMYLTNAEERELLLRYYNIAREEMPQVFGRLKQQLYPVLLKLLSEKYIESDLFFQEMEGEILTFLGLAEDDLVRDMPESAAKSILGQPQAKENPTPGVQTPPRLAFQGLNLLDQLFPRAGWLSLADNPDLFGYFQTVFEYPKGSDLIPVDDPIQVIQPLSEVLQQLFYGFQNLQWGTNTNSAGELVRLQEEFDKSIARWHFFHEEFFGKNYLPLLQEYCREVERTGPMSNDAKRKEHQLLWFKRNYLLPHLTLPIMDDVRVKSMGYPNLAIQVREMLDLLAPIAVDVEEKGTKSTALMNPDAKVRFPVTNIVCQRFQNVLRRTDTGDRGEKRLLDQGHNRSLLHFTLAILSTLDHFLSRPASQLYSRKPAYLYRTSGIPGDDKPVYNAPQRNSLGLLKKLNEQAPPALADHPWPTKIGDLYSQFRVATEVKARISEYLNEKKPFSLVSFRVWPTHSGPRFLRLVAPLLDPGTRLHPQDDGTWLYTLKDTLEEEAEDFCRKILLLAAREEPPLALGALVVPFFTSGTLEKLITTPSRGWADAAELKPQILGIWNNSAQTFGFRNDLPELGQADESSEEEPLLQELEAAD